MKVWWSFLRLVGLGLWHLHHHRHCNRFMVKILVKVCILSVLQALTTSCSQIRKGSQWTKSRFMKFMNFILILFFVSPNHRCATTEVPNQPWSWPSSNWWKGFDSGTGTWFLSMSNSWNQVVNVHVFLFLFSCFSIFQLWIVDLEIKLKLYPSLKMSSWCFQADDFWNPGCCRMFGYSESTTFWGDHLIMRSDLRCFYILYAARYIQAHDQPVLMVRVSSSTSPWFLPAVLQSYKVPRNLHVLLDFLDQSCRWQKPWQIPCQAAVTVLLEPKRKDFLEMMVTCPESDPVSGGGLFRNCELGVPAWSQLFFRVLSFVVRENQ